MSLLLQSRMLASQNNTTAGEISLSGCDFVTIGDSKTSDTAPTSGAGNTWPAQFMALPVASGATLHNYAINGRTLATIIAQYSVDAYTKRPAATGKVAYVSVRSGSNDLSSDMSAFWTALSAHYATLRTDGFKVIAWTITPRSGQSAAVNAEIYRINNLIRSSSHLWDYMIDAAVVLPDSTNTIYYSDGLHETAAGNRVHAYFLASIISDNPLVAANLGSMAFQLSSAISVTGGSIDGVTIGATTRGAINATTGSFTGAVTCLAGLSTTTFSASGAATATSFTASTNFGINVTTSSGDATMLSRCTAAGSSRQWAFGHKIADNAYGFNYYDGSAWITDIFKIIGGGTYRGIVFGGVQMLRGAGSPESVVTGSVGDAYHRTDGGAGTSFYVKESGTATNTGWVGK